MRCTEIVANATVCAVNPRPSSQNRTSAAARARTARRASSVAARTPASARAARTWGGRRSTSACSGTVTHPWRTATATAAVAPAVRLDEPADEREEDRRGEPCHDGDGEDRPGPPRRRRPGDRRREGGLVEHGRADRADTGPHRVERHRVADAGEREEQQRAEHRAGGHQCARPVPVEPAPDRHGERGGREHRARERARARGPADPEVGGDRSQEHREGVPEAAVPDRLGHRERDDDRPATTGHPVVAGRGRGGRVRHPQQAAPVAGPAATGSSVRSAVPAAQVPVPSGTPAQTPVSGRSRCTSRAADQSPASAAATERTCS